MTHGSLVSRCCPARSTQQHLNGCIPCASAFAAMVNQGHFTLKSLPERYINRPRHLLRKYHTILNLEVPPGCHINLPKLSEPHKARVAARKSAHHLALTLVLPATAAKCSGYKHPRMKWCCGIKEGARRHSVRSDTLASSIRFSERLGKDFHVERWSHHSFS